MVTFEEIREFHRKERASPKLVQLPSDFWKKVAEYFAEKMKKYEELKKIASFKMPIIVGKITVTADAYDEDGISKVEFYIDGILKYNDTQQPYQWIWNEKAIGKHEIKVIAYDNEGNEAEDRISVVIFNFGGKK